MKCELRVHVPRGYKVPVGFTVVPATDDFPVKEYRASVQGDYRSVSAVAAKLNVTERAAYEASDMNSQDTGRTFYPHPLQLIAQ